MKGAQGLFVAILFGGLGVVLNWIYLTNKVRDAHTVGFIGVQSGAMIKKGDVIREEDLIRVSIPQFNARSLKDFAYLWADLNTVVGIQATRDYQGGDFIYIADYRTPPQVLELADDEQLIWVPVDGRGFVPSLINPGDKITFIIPTGGNSSNPTGQNPIPLAGFEEVGPFTIKTMGNRLGSSDVLKASRIAQVQERDIGIVVKRQGDKLEPKAIKLMDLLAKSNRRNISIALHPRD